MIKNRKLILILIVLLAFVSILSICIGSVEISPFDIIKSLTNNDACSTANKIILYARLPRFLGCLFAGAALSCAGAIIQGVLDNPLAAPNIIGVNAGAGLAASVFSAFFPMSFAFLPIAAFVGAMFAVLLVLFVAKKTGLARITLVLAGVAISAVFSAGIDALITFFPSSLVGYNDFKIGGLANLSLNRILPAIIVISIFLIIAFSFSKIMNILVLGDDVAKSLGVNVDLMRIVLLIIAAALCGGAVSYAGLLGFIGLIVPHIMRRFVGNNYRYLIVSCALGGSIFLLICDILARVLFVPFELPVGILLSLIGGPFFIFLLISQKKGRVHD